MKKVFIKLMLAVQNRVKNLLKRKEKQYKSPAPVHVGKNFCVTVQILCLDFGDKCYDEWYKCSAGIFVTCKSYVTFVSLSFEHLFFKKIVLVLLDGCTISLGAH